MINITCIYLHNIIVGIEEYLSCYILNFDRVFTRGPNVCPPMLIHMGDDSRLLLLNLVPPIEFFFKEFLQAAQHLASFLLSWLPSLYLFFLLVSLNSLSRPLS